MRTNSPISIECAIEIFVGGFSVVRSRTYPFVPNRIEDAVWLMRDAARTKDNYRNEEYVACGVPAARMDELSRKHTRGRYFISMIRRLDEDSAELRDGFKSIGYRLMWTEPFFVHYLQGIGLEFSIVRQSQRGAPPHACLACLECLGFFLELGGPFQIARVETAEQVRTLSTSAKSRKIKLEQLVGDRAVMRQYMAILDDNPIGWVTSVPIGDCAWCSNLFVKPVHRRKGAARSLLNRMLKDDRAAGLQANVLLSSHTGAKLYPTVGYEMIGELMMFTTPKAHVDHQIQGGGGPHKSEESE